MIKEFLHKLHLKSRKSEAWLVTKYVIIKVFMLRTLKIQYRLSVVIRPIRRSIKINLRFFLLIPLKFFLVQILNLPNIVTLYIVISCRIFLLLFLNNNNKRYFFEDSVLIITFATTTAQLSHKSVFLYSRKLTQYVLNGTVCVSAPTCDWSLLFR